MFFAVSKKKIFFAFHHEQKEVKQDFVVMSKSPLFPTDTPRICSITSWFYFFFRKKRREKILSLSIEQVLYFFLSLRNGGRKFYACR